MKTNYHYLPHEYEHLKFLKENAYECTLFLKRDDDSFPLDGPREITLIGNGVRNTVIGGTGSGAVNVRYSENIEEAFLNAGFTISSTDWLNQYEKNKEEIYNAFVKQVKKEAREHHRLAANYAFGRTPSEGEYEFPIFSNDHEVAIYILSRKCGEGADRVLDKGDIYLSDSEVRDILMLNRTYKKFLLVLNAGGIVDLTPIMEVKNILLISQLGSMTGDILANIVLGNYNPSGKLTDTWANIKDYPYIDTPISPDEVRYKEGIYVGYRYFESAKVEPIFPFGFGLSYTTFTHKVLSVENVKDKIVLKVNVTNTGKCSGKEVIQAYLSGDPTRPAIELVAYKKSGLLKPKESEELELAFSLSEFPTYDEKKEAYVFNKGTYLIKTGNSSKNLKDVLGIEVKEDVIIKQTKNVFAKPDFEDLKINLKPSSIPASLKTITLTKEDFSCSKIEYKGKYIVPIPEVIKKLSIDELIRMCLGDFKYGFIGQVGQSANSIVGGAGESCAIIKSIPQTINMVDGPAGLRITQEYVTNPSGVYPISEDSVMTQLRDYIPKIALYFVTNDKNKNKKGTRILQIATAIPVATALAQSFNMDFVKECGRLVEEEIELYGVNVWLAPALNIHRHILCGRNFEYYSEDPLISALCASAITLGVQENSKSAVTLKHFACNNTEVNRVNSNSLVSERTIRDIYLPGFEKTIKWSSPRAIMTSYNLIDGVHTSEHYGLIVDILRNEWGYKGLVMTDWITSGNTYRDNNKYPSAYASRNIKNGNDICMPGGRPDVRDIKKALKSGYLSREDLELSAAILLDFINNSR